MIARIDEGSGVRRTECDPQTLYRTIRACRICRDAPLGEPLPIEPNPVLALSSTARILVAGQAPGNLADKTSTPFNDPSGRRLRDWLGITAETFYDASRVAIVPMGFCFPGTDAKGGDRPPRRECARTWHDDVMRSMPQIGLILAIGGYAQAYHIEGNGRRNLTETVADWRRVLRARTDGADAGGGADGGPRGRFAPVMPLPHPSWRNNGWLKRHPWFEADLLPELKRRVGELT